MADAATVLVVKSTGHVLATLTRVGNPGGALQPADLAGDSFPVRSSSGDVFVDIAADALDVQSVPLVDDLLIQPQKCAVDQSQAQLLSGTVTVAQFGATGVKVHLTSPATKETKVLVQADTGTGSTREHTVLEGTIAVNASDVTISHTFAPGDYDVLVLVAGFAPNQSSRTV